MQKEFAFRRFKRHRNLCTVSKKIVTNNIPLCSQIDFLYLCDLRSPSLPVRRLKMDWPVIRRRTNVGHLQLSGDRFLLCHVPISMDAANGYTGLGKLYVHDLEDEDNLEKPLCRLRDVPAFGECDDRGRRFVLADDDQASLAVCQPVHFIQPLFTNLKIRRMAKARPQEKRVFKTARRRSGIKKSPSVLHYDPGLGGASA